ALERNEWERACFVAEIGNYPREYLVFFDEAANDKKTLERRFGYSIAGRRSIHIAPFVRGVRYSIIAAISLSHGYLAFSVEEGALDGLDVFDFAVNKLVRKMQCHCFLFIHLIVAASRMQ
ncbi:hypothetical protein BDR26DRAFT_800922, partial [Obelidium mucronatum]